jgi:hypothetical protein
MGVLAMIKTDTLHVEKRWALIAETEIGLRFLGKHCWSEVEGSDPMIRTFKTKRQAVAARVSIGCKAKAVQVELTVREIKG